MGILRNIAFGLVAVALAGALLKVGWQYPIPTISTIAGGAVLAAIWHYGSRLNMRVTLRRSGIGLGAIAAYAALAAGAWYYPVLMFRGALVVLILGAAWYYGRRLPRRRTLIWLGAGSAAVFAVILGHYFPLTVTGIALLTVIGGAVWYYSRPAPDEYAELPPTAIGQWLADQDNRCYALAGLTALALIWAIIMGPGEPLLNYQFQKFQAASSLALNDEHTSMLRYWYGSQMPQAPQPTGFWWSWKWWILMLILAITTAAYRLWTYREELARLWSQAIEQAREAIEALRATRQAAVAAPPTGQPAQQSQSEGRIFVREVTAAMLPAVGQMLLDWRRRGGGR